MIPILLQAHTRSLTKVIYNHSGDLLFSASKDDKPNVWRTINGERLGSYNGHRGTVWSLDVTRDSAILASGSADNSFRLWDVECGKSRNAVETDTGVRSVAWAMGDQLLAVLTDNTMGFTASVLIYDVRAGEVVRKVLPNEIGKKPTIVRWTDCNEALLTGHDDGHVALWDAASSKLLTSTRPHSDTIRDLQFSRDRTYFITASKDTTAKLIETANLKAIKTYQTERPVNSAAISPVRTEVLVAGGQEALNVTTTSSRAGQFEARFFHEIWESEIGRVRGHFGPINTLAYAPDGRGYASGAEDGYIRLHSFDPDYYEFAMIDPDLDEPLL
ncbi:WD40 repeat-like protein [Paramicrosporidium saccamoebae]|uniref:Eukaryotic translation initiation factor 3 subunit I n=1 Tax=Paramicrosporidium saccamoebae TaxID=1246581 RepID=A0A2H9TJC5_9FUNG|nr:WD40 repeat-like protein [Paramicrosporidium saccamoebae]